MLRTGKQLFDTSCVTCHGVNLQGVTDRGPSLVGVGEAAVYFQVSTGRMPAMRGEAQAPQKPAQFDEAQIDALGAYVQANGGGPTVPRDAERPGRTGIAARRRRRPRRRPVPAELRVLPQLHRQRRRAVLGQVRARSDRAEPAQIYTAMLTGPQNMPKFSDRQLSPDEKRDIVAYVRMATERPTPAATASAASDRRRRAWPSGSSASWPSSALALWIGARA